MTPSPTPPADDLVRRRPVWEALSTLFLDTEIDAAWRAQIVATRLASGYTDAELDAILWDDISPVLHTNLLAPVGEWAGFDMEWVEQQILAARPTRLRRWVAFQLGGRLVRDTWDQIRHDVAARRAS